MVLSPNRSMQWNELLCFYLLTCLLALVIGLFFCLQGLWLVLPFSGLEMLLLGIALYVTSRNVYRREVITLDNRRIRVEKGVRQISQSWEFDIAWVRLLDEAAANSRLPRKLRLGAHGKFVEVGEFLDRFEKDALAFKLKGCIILV